jgi:ubiquinone/menaquinone biosynthesis C-methylase UbiE
MKMLVNVNNLLSLFTGSYKDISGMKDRVKRGYEGEYSSHVHHYDELGYHLRDRSARIQLENISLKGMKVLDIGCGIGAIPVVAFEQAAEQVICGDISAYMLQEARSKSNQRRDDYTFCQLDAEDLPYQTGSVDAAITGMPFGTLPDQKKVVSEMVRVVKPGGWVCVGAHGPEYYWEAIDATLRSINKRYVLGYRFEWWPVDEKELKKLLVDAGLIEIQSKRVIWRNQFKNGGEAYDFFAAISASWWYAKFPPHEAEKDSIRTRAFLMRNNLDIVSDDIVIAFGIKPITSEYG